MTEITTRPLLSALPPTEAELAARHALSREEPLARYREADENMPNLRGFRFQARTVFYTEEADFIPIRAVLHQARDIRPNLFDRGEAAGRRLMFGRSADIRD